MLRLRHPVLFCMAVNMVTIINCVNSSRECVPEISSLHQTGTDLSGKDAAEADLHLVKQILLGFIK